MALYHAFLGTASRVERPVNAPQPRTFDAGAPGLNRRRVSAAEGEYAPETTSGLEGLLHAAELLGPGGSEDRTQPSTSDSEASESASIMSESTNAGGIRSSASEKAGKQNCGELAGARLEQPIVLLKLGVCVHVLTHFALSRGGAYVLLLISLVHAVVSEMRWRLCLSLFNLVDLDLYRISAPLG